MPLNRIAVLDGYGDDDPTWSYAPEYNPHDIPIYEHPGYTFPLEKPHRRKGSNMAKKRSRRRKTMSVKQRKHLARFKKAAKSCSRRRSGSFKNCMKKKLKKKGRR